MQQTLSNVKILNWLVDDEVDMFQIESKLSSVMTQDILWKYFCEGRIIQRSNIQTSQQRNANNIFRFFRPLPAPRSFCFQSSFQTVPEAFVSFASLYITFMLLLRINILHEAWYRYHHEMFEYSKQSEEKLCNKTPGVEWIRNGFHMKAWKLSLCFHLWFHDLWTKLHHRRCCFMLITASNNLRVDSTGWVIQCW